MANSQAHEKRAGADIRLPFSARKCDRRARDLSDSINTFADLALECHVITAADVSARPDLDAEHVSDPFVTTPREGIGWQLERAIRKFLLPGVTGTQWAFARSPRGTELCQHRHKDARITVLSTYPPLGTHLAGFWFSRQDRCTLDRGFQRSTCKQPGERRNEPISQHRLSRSGAGLDPQGCVHHC